MNIILAILAILLKILICKTNRIARIGEDNPSHPGHLVRILNGKTNRIARIARMGEYYPCHPGHLVKNSHKQNKQDSQDRQDR